MEIGFILGDLGSEFIFMWYEEVPREFFLEITHAIEKEYLGNKNAHPTPG